MDKKLMEKAKKYGIYAVLAAALLISAAVSAAIDKKDSKRVIIYSGEKSESMTAEDDSSKAKTTKNKKVTEAKTSRTSKVTTEKTTKQTTTKTSKTAKVNTSKTQTEDNDITEIYFPMDINLVTFEELTAINGIGESTALAILDLRKRLGIISNLEQLLEISGIGSSKLDMLYEYLYVDDADYSPPDFTSEDEQTEDTSDMTEETDPSEDVSETESQAEERREVNINEADEEELMECLLIDEELAQGIIEIREQLGGKYENSLQLLYVKGISKEMLSEMKEYVII